ncbi:MAG: redox-regulated ATPase YchF [Bacteroidetes bacterium]|nr:redox-regulated ATPase YchF [Bacteroidota bacterium]MBU1423712.1 redox-regulated ATPase YchF [Bacteroidota bacterium]MBU2635872.1 redox-regulated ATPase YchF [Bacteroidota bacterium]
MGFNCGIVGLPNVGKSTIFNAITSAKAIVANYPFTTIEPHSGVVPVPDERLNVLAKILQPPKIIPTNIEFVDIAGLVKGANKGEGLGNQFLAHIREVDAVVHVVRCFENDNVVHTYGSIDPKRDVEIVETELILKDIETIQKNLSELERQSKSGDKKVRHAMDVCRKLEDHLSTGKLAKMLNLNEEEKALACHLHLLTAKPVMFIANVDEEGLTKGNEYIRVVEELAVHRGSTVLVVDGEIEAELADISYEEREAFLSDLGIKESGLDKVIHNGYWLLDLITFFTHNQKELRAWTVKKGTKAPQAAGKIHSDFEKGFIKAEVIKIKDLVAVGSESALREKGLLHIQGKEYQVEDGDVVFFRFNV